VLSSILSFLLILSLLSLATLLVFVVYLIVRYTPIIGRIFEEKPMFLPLRVAPRPEGEGVRFRSADGLDLVGTYLPARSHRRAGVLVFCHEFLSDRWSYHPYCDGLRDLGFDLFTFDFRNHGVSASDRVYQPLQWVSDHEVRDLEAALDYLRSRDDRDPAGFGLYGISRGGGAAMVVAAGQPDVWGVITDGAFPTTGTMMPYILRWAQIFVTNRVIYALLRNYAPYTIFGLLGWVARRRAERRLSCRFPSIEKAVARLSPRPLLMIHGGKDAYIGPDIARRLFDRAGEPKDLWIVPKAKHNRCREVESSAYNDRIEEFFRRNSPRPPVPVADAIEENPPARPAPAPNNHPGEPATVHTSVLERTPIAPPAQSLAGGLIAPIPG
jgi:pimeloyl-ACP methyl ester carboxylesterase